FNSSCAIRRNKQMKRFLSTLFGIALALPAFAQSVSVKEGNIQFTNKTGQTTTLTSSSHDSDPSLSPDGKTIVFARATPERNVPTGSGDDTSEIWLLGVDGKNARKIVEPKA